MSCINEEFEIMRIDNDYKTLMTGKSYEVNKYIGLEDLRVIKIMYYGFDNKGHSGELVVHHLIANKVIDIFKELYSHQFPIESVRLIDYYEADDELSMAANNSSAFNYRVIKDTNKLSNHSFGLAIDINPVCNPYVTKSAIYPKKSEGYIDRNKVKKGMIIKEDCCYNAFISRGFEWGGDWSEYKDYQHFDIKIEDINR